MNDGPLQQLYDRLPELAGPVWWFADEQVSGELPAARSDCHVFSNRCDTAQALSAEGFSVSLGDFDVPATLEAPPQTIVYRVSKERPLVNMLINDDFPTFDRPIKAYSARSGGGHLATSLLLTINFASLISTNNYFE